VSTRRPRVSITGMIPRGAPASRDDRIRMHWHVLYEVLRSGDSDHGVAALDNRAARHAANSLICSHHALTVRQIQNIRKGGVAASRVGNARKLDARMRRFRDMLATVERAVTNIDSALLAKCSILAHVKAPSALRFFSSSDEATRADSLQQLAAVLAEAFLRAEKGRMEAEARLRKNQTRAAAEQLFPDYNGGKTVRRN